ncbi:CPBP family intramembrane glutamic endopeptidase [Streptomyces bugieae]|uniref:CPBP family intramembrane glutamic endopeptidase n=1 Tax=Streptomyces bugieae TaxID=3098223 RepID=A0ABU7NP84_9ACTN|nr:CPBP family intramembrane glutamic endopeptidase [Streptomyces sp. DSM 41528]
MSVILRTPRTKRPVRAGRATDRTGVAAFLALSFGGTWGWLWCATAVFGLSPLNPLLQVPACCMPSIAAVVVRRWVTREGFADAGLGLRLKTAWPYYLAAWLCPAALAACTLGLAVLFGLWHPQLSGLGGVLPGADDVLTVLGMMMASLVLTPLYWGEEFGWTSYLRPRLFGGALLPSSLVTGLIWAVWHVPLAFIGYVDFPNMALGLLVWTVSFQFQEVILMWLYTRSGSIWVASLAHAGNNMVLSLVLGQVLDEGAGLGPTWPMVLSTIPLAVLSLAITVHTRRRTAVRRTNQ